MTATQPAVAVPACGSQAGEAACVADSDIDAVMDRTEK